MWSCWLETLRRLIGAHDVWLNLVITVQFARGVGLPHCLSPVAFLQRHAMVVKTVHKKQAPRMRARQETDDGSSQDEPLLCFWCARRCQITECDKCGLSFCNRHLNKNVHICTPCVECNKRSVMHCDRCDLDYCRSHCDSHVCDWRCNDDANWAWVRCLALCILACNPNHVPMICFYFCPTTCSGLMLMHWLLQDKLCLCISAWFAFRFAMLFQHSSLCVCIILSPSSTSTADRALCWFMVFCNKKKWVCAIQIELCACTCVCILGAHWRSHTGPI